MRLGMRMNRKRAGTKGNRCSNGVGCNFRAPKIAPDPFYFYGKA
jgi:hypothetical protein